VIRRYISTSPKRKLRNNIDVIVYFAGNNEVGQRALQQRKDIDIDIADILGQKYPYRIDVGKGVSTHLYSQSVQLLQT